MKQVVFLAKSYRDYLNSWILSQSNAGRGLKSRMADVIGTKTGFITQVFRELADFSLEQALSIANWIGMDEIEKEFFLILVQRDRAGTKDLEQYFNSQLERIRKTQNNLSKRLVSEVISSELDQATYFSSWLYSCVHVLLTCKGPHTTEIIAKRLGISLLTCRKILDFLVHSGLAIEKAGFYETGKVVIHLGTESVNLLKHHLNWNLRSIQAMESDIKRGLHYSSIVSISKDDYHRIREELIRTIESTKSIVQKSPGEILSGFTLNLFEVGEVYHL